MPADPHPPTEAPERCWCGWRGRGGAFGHTARLLWSVFITGRTYRA